MAAIPPSQLDTIAAFLEKSREYLDIEYAIRLHWPRLQTGSPRSAALARPRRPDPAGKRRQAGKDSRPYACPA